MKDYTTDSPVFFDKISLVEKSDLVNYQNKNASEKQLLQNTLFLKAWLKRLFGEDPDRGDSKKIVATFTSNDSETANAWTNVAAMQSEETHESLFGKISTMFKNVRYLYKMLGTTDISQIGGGTVTKAIQSHNTEIGKKVYYTDITQSAAVNVAGKKALDAIEKNAAVEGTLANELSKINSNFGFMYGPHNNTFTNISIPNDKLTRVCYSDPLPAGIYLLCGYICYFDENLNSGYRGFGFGYDTDAEFLNFGYAPISNQRTIANGSWILNVANGSCLSVFARHNAGSTVVCDACMSWIKLR